MDTNLLDSCREARGELEHNYPPEIKYTELKKVSNLSDNNFIIINGFSNILFRKLEESHMMSISLI